MGITGPKPTPNALKRLAGVRKSRIKPEPVMPATKNAKCPDYLEEVAAAKWKELYALLNKAGVLRATDLGILALCCDAYYVWRKASKQLHETKSLEVQTPNGGVQQAPIVATERNAKLVYMRALSELGLTPSSRGRLTGDNAKEDDDGLMGFLKAGCKAREHGPQDKGN